MSRCFPFPPPGYERKVGADNVDVLKQDKHREKKHKKEKRDKEKREGKEKKEKDRGDEKHRDKKEKKDKHRDKKDKEKDKDKERERDRSSTSNEKNQPVQVGYIKQEKLLDHKGAPASQAGEKSTLKEKDKTRNSIADSKRPSGGQNGERVVSANHVASRVSDAKCIQELAKRLKNDQCSGSEQASAIPDQRKNDVKGQHLGKAAGAGLEGKERTKDRRHNNNNNEKKMDERVIKEQTGLNGTVKVQSFGEAPGRTKLQEIAKPSEVNAKEMEWREVMSGRECDDKRVLKDQYIDKSKGKVKESRKKEEMSEQKHSDQEKSKASNKNGLLGTPHINSLQPMNEPDKTVAAEGNLKKRKAETNGFLLGDEVRANKLQKQAQVFQPPVKNGMETHQMTTKMTPSRLEPVSNVKVNKEDKKINGVKGGAHASPISPLHHPPSSAAQAGLLLAAEASVKPPHPDSKFLGEILKIPKLDELPDLDDDQGWLFSSTKEDFNKSNGGKPSVLDLERRPEEVWGESIHIESADIYALPYVFPY